MSNAIEKEMIHGAIGEAATIEFDAYLRTARDLPNIEAILEQPTKAPVPKSPAQLYALATSLAQYTREHGKSAMKYVARARRVRTSLRDGRAAWRQRHSRRQGDWQVD